ncbi:UPF0149 family protein [Pseudomonas sp.]|uniref:UPF0149 family protein n=1 Tax=Pseudomonas sp. TaxID=306 RepID=UPI0028AE7DCA|nr:UPF0149 family protein [Pseudomonas sp.]
MLAVLSEKEINRLEDMLITYGNDYSVLNVAELNGFFTALASSPTVITPERWLPEVAGGAVPKFKKPADEEAYTALMIRYAVQVAQSLAAELDAFEPLFETSETEEGPGVILEEWCFGYMRGTQVAEWAPLPPLEQGYLDMISLHGLEDNIELIDAMNNEARQACVPVVTYAARDLYRYQRQSRR